MKVEFLQNLSVTKAMWNKTLSLFCKWEDEATSSSWIAKVCGSSRWQILGLSISCILTLATLICIHYCCLDPLLQERLTLQPTLSWNSLLQATLFLNSQLALCFGLLRAEIANANPHTQLLLTRNVHWATITEFCSERKHCSHKAVRWLQMSRRSSFEKWEQPHLVFLSGPGQRSVFHEVLGTGSWIHQQMGLVQSGSKRGKEKGNTFW